MRSSAMAMTAVMLAGAAALAVACVTGGASAQEPPASRGGTVTDDTIYRDVEVMRRVLVKEGLGAGTGTPAAMATETAMLVTYLQGSRSASSSEAFVVAGDGVTFLLRTSDPVAPSRHAQKDEKAAAEPSAWDEAEAEIEGRTKMPRFTLGADRYDAAKVEALRGRLVATLAQYGQKVRGLAPSDHLTVVVAGSRTGAVTMLTTAAGTPSGTVVDQDGRLLTRHPDQFVAGTSTVLTIRVAVADCQAFARGELDLDGFRKRAVISSY